MNIPPAVQLAEFTEDFPFEGLKAWGALTLLFRKGFRGSYAEICHELGWLDRHGKPMKSMVSRAIRHAKEKGGIPKDARFQATA